MVLATFDLIQERIETNDYLSFDEKLLLNEELEQLYQEYISNCEKDNYSQGNIKIEKEYNRIYKRLDELMKEFVN